VYQNWYINATLSLPIMSRHRYEQLLVKRGQLNHSWEEVIAYDYKLSDLSHEEIYKTVADGIRENRIPASAQREDISQILERLNLTIEGKLKRAAVVLYAKQESMKFSQCMIKMARFKGINKLGDFIDNQQLYGNAFFLLSEADAFLRRHLPIASFFKPDQFKRIDKPALPVMAVREALINALCHRDYAQQGTDISLAIFDDCLEIWNSGTLSKELSIESLRHYHDSVLRNKLIANVFYVRGMIEKWGSGTNKMIDLCREASIPEPKFIERTGGLAVIFKFREPISITSHKSKNKISLNVRQEAILHILSNKKPLSAAEIFSKLKNPPSLRTVKSDLSALQELGLVEQQGKGPNTLWKSREN
jgi:ATP-dependent DNA helicase RecG